MLNKEEVKVDNQIEPRKAKRVIKILIKFIDHIIKKDGEQYN